MSEPFLSEIKIISFSFAPKGWAFCNGQLLPINQNQALFALIGTTYGGNGTTTFGLPDLRARTPMHEGSGHTLGERAGEVAHALTIAEMPQHTHQLNGDANAGNTPIPTGNPLADSPSHLYAPAGTLTTLSPASVTQVGGSQAHENMSPYLVLNFIIALQGIFPSQN